MTQLSLPPGYDSHCDGKLIGITFCDSFSFNHNFPEATMFNTGGYRLPPDIPSYSPIDLSVALLSNSPLLSTCKSLSDFFEDKNNKEYILIGERLTSLVFLINNTYQSGSVAEWKYYISESKNKHLLEIFNANAPFNKIKFKG